MRKASYALGVALEDEGRLREAKAAYEQALAAAHGDYARADFRLGLIAGNSGDVQEAIVLFRKALNRSGEHVIASHNNLGVMLARMRRLKEAEKEFAYCVATIQR
jgi:tetratricopeptide (TPR) repeat protein